MYSFFFEFILQFIPFSAFDISQKSGSFLIVWFQAIILQLDFCSYFELLSSQKKSSESSYHQNIFLDRVNDLYILAMLDVTFTPLCKFTA